MHMHTANLTVQLILSKNQGEGMTFLPGMGWGGGDSSDFFPWGGNLLERLENGGRYHTKKIMQRFLAIRF